MFKSQMNEMLETVATTELPADLESFFADHHDRLFGALWLVTRDRHEAEDLAQEAFLKVWERWDRVGGPAHVIEFGNWGGDIIERLYVDPTTHELLAWTKTAAAVDRPFEYFVVQGAGVVDSSEVAPSPQEGSIPSPLEPLPDMPAETPTRPPSCSQGGPELTLTAQGGAFDTDCLVVEAGSPFTIELHAQDAGVADNVSIHRSGSDAEDAVFVGETVTGPNTVTYELPPLDAGTYVFRSDLHPQMRGTLWVA